MLPSSHPQSAVSARDLIWIAAALRAWRQLPLTPGRCTLAILHCKHPSSSCKGGASLEPVQGVPGYCTRYSEPRVTKAGFPWKLYLDLGLHPGKRASHEGPLRRGPEQLLLHCRYGASSYRGGTFLDTTPEPAASPPAWTPSISI